MYVLQSSMHAWISKCIQTFIITEEFQSVFDVHWKDKSMNWIQKDKLL